MAELNIIDTKEKQKAYNHQYYLDHKDEAKEYNRRKYLEENPTASTTRGRKKKYNTEEEKVNARRRYNDVQVRKKGVINYEKRFKIRKDGFSAIIGTLNRLVLNTCYIEGKIVVISTDDTDINTFKSIRNVMLADIKDYLNSQDMWDKKKRILIVEIPESFSKYANTKTNTISFQYTLLRGRKEDWTADGSVTGWHKLHKGLEPFVEHHYQVIKKAVEDNGTQLAYRVGKLTDEPVSWDEDSTSDTT